MKMDKKTKTLIPNPKYNFITPTEAVKHLTKMLSTLTHDRSLKELTKDERIYFRVNEPQKMELLIHIYFCLFQNQA